MRYLAGLSALLLLASACVGPAARQDPEIPFDIPAAWSTADDAGTIDDGWLAAFGSPELEAIVRRAIEFNPDLAASAARLDRAAAEARIAGAPLKPSVNASTSAARARNNFIGIAIPGAPDVITSTSTTLSLGVSTSWEVDLWGRLRAGARAAVAELEATSADHRAARLSLAGQTAKAWFAAVSARQQLELAEATVRSLETSLEQARSRYERGLRPSIDVRLSTANLEQERARVELRRQGLDTALRRLELLIGTYPAGAFDAGRELPPIASPVPAGLPADLVGRRPDLIAAERRLAGADERVAQARRALYPRLSLTAGGGTTSNELRDLLDGDFRVWNLVGNLTQPLFQGGRLRAGVAAARAGAEESVARYASAVLRAYSEVERALAAETLLAERERHLTSAVHQARAARRLAEDRYRSGIDNYLTVLESQRRALLTESEWLTVRRERLDNRVDLHLALGGSFESSRES